MGNGIPCWSFLGVSDIVTDGLAELRNLLVSDVVMPNMDGPTLAQKIRERRPDLKIIFISGYAEDAFKKHPGGPQDVAFLPKPFSLSQLAGKVKEVLAERR